jgi:hypothetical protein
MIEWKNLRQPEIDVYLFNTFRVKVVIPFLAGQTPGFSNIEGMERDYDGWFNYTETSIATTKHTLGQLIGNAPGIQFPKFMTR